MSQSTKEQFAHCPRTVVSSNRAQTQKQDKSAFFKVRYPGSTGASARNVAEFGTAYIIGLVLLHHGRYPLPFLT